jgi:hypothetical protein
MNNHYFQNHRNKKFHPGQTVEAVWDAKTEIIYCGTEFNNEKI